MKEVDAIAIRIEEKRKEREIKEKYMKEMEENLHKERKELFQYLVTGSKSVAELLETADRLDIDLSAMWYNIVLLKIQSESHAYNEYSNSLIEVEKSWEELERIQKTYLEKIKQMLSAYEHIRYFGGIGTPVNRLRELPASFESASHAFAHRYLVKESLILDCKEMEKGIYREKEEFNISNVNPRQIDRSKIKEFLKFGDLEEIIYFVEEFFKALGSNAMKSSLFRQYITIDIYFCVVEFLEGLQFNREEIESLDDIAEIVQSKEDATRYVTRIFRKALEIREKAASNRYGDIVDEVMRYIEKNYADDELSLNSVASHVNFSPNHLSMIFSQQTGGTFSKYLTDFRMNKAKELLRCTGKRSSVISMEVGYKDPHYFSYLFKKTQGMTPTQYRGGKNPEGDD